MINEIQYDLFKNWMVEKKTSTDSNWEENLNFLNM